MTPAAKEAWIQAAKIANYWDIKGMKAGLAKKLGSYISKGGVQATVDHSVVQGTSKVLGRGSVDGMLEQSIKNAFLPKFAFSGTGFDQIVKNAAASELEQPIVRIVVQQQLADIAEKAGRTLLENAVRDPALIPQLAVWFSKMC